MTKNSSPNIRAAPAGAASAVTSTTNTKAPLFSTSIFRINPKKMLTRTLSNENLVTNMFDDSVLLEHESNYQQHQHQQEQSRHTTPIEERFLGSGDLESGGGRVDADGDDDDEEAGMRSPRLFQDSHRSSGSSSSRHGGHHHHLHSNSYEHSHSKDNSENAHGPSSKFESLDYDQCENMLQLEEESIANRYVWEIGESWN